MHIGIGLPTSVPGATGPLLVAWAQMAEDGPFSSLGVVDRIVYDSYDPLTTLATAAAVTSRIRLATTIAISPLYNTISLAKMTASLDALSNGRLVLGLAIGARKEDYDAANVDYHTRGQRFSTQLASLRSLWEEKRICPGTARPVGPPLLIGGSSEQTPARVARHANGYVHGGGPPRTFARVADKVRAAWTDIGRSGKPLLWAQGYFTLGDDDTVQDGLAYMRDYYAFTGPFAERIAAGLLTTPQAIAQFVRGYAEAGCDELVLFPAVAQLKQIELLSAVLHTLDKRTFDMPTDVHAANL